MSSQFRVFVAGGAVALILAGANARAEEPTAPGSDTAVSSYTEDDLFRFLEDELEVTTASQMKTKIAEVPQAVYVITREEIARMPALNLADLLRNIPGLIVTNPSHAQWSVGVEAPVPVNNALVLVMVDGRSIYSPYTWLNEWWPIPYAPDDIERVEVVMGPAATVHGSQAVFGVVNFITRGATRDGATGRAVIGGSHGADLRARFGDISTHASGTILLGPVRLRAGGGYERLTPWDNPFTLVDNQLVEATAGQRGFGNLRADIELSDDVALTLLAGASGYEGPWVSFGPGSRRGFYAYGDGELRIRRLLSEDDELTLRTFFRGKRHNSEAPLHTLLPSAIFDMEEYLALARVLYTAGLPLNNRLVTAIEARLDNSEFDMIDPPGRTYGYFSVFLQDEFRPFDSLIFSGGVRAETQYRDGLEFFERLAVTPQASAVWLPGAGHSLRLAYGQATFYQGGFYEYGNARTYDHVLQIYRGDPNTTRDPMHILEAGYRGQIHSSLLITLSYACRVMQSRFWISFGEGETLPLRFTRFSGTETRHSLDATASFRPSSILRMDLALTWLIHADRPAAYEDLVGKPPQWRLSAIGHLAPNDRVNFDVALQYVSSRSARTFTTAQEIEVAGWIYLNVKLAYVFLEEPRLEIYGLATNLTDTRLGEGIHAEMPDLGVSRVGRRFLLGLGAEF